MLHRLSFFAGFICVVLLSACGLSGAKKITVPELPDGYKIVSSALQKNDSGIMEPFFLMQNRKKENQYLLYPSGRKFAGKKIFKLIMGPYAGNFLCWYGDAAGSEFLITATGQIPVSEDSVPVLCKNGKDYAILREQGGRIKTQVIFVNGQKKLTADKSIQKLIFSPDGSRLIYSVQDGRSITIRDVFSPDSAVSMPSIAREYYSFSFGPDQILRINYRDSDSEWTREEDSFFPDENETDNEEKLLADRSLFFYKKDGPVFLRGRQIRLPEKMIDYAISPDFTSVLTLGIDVITEKEKKKNAQDIGMEVLSGNIRSSKKEFLLSIQTAVNGHRLMQKPAALSKYSFNSFSGSGVSAEDIRNAGLKFHIDFGGGGLPLCQISLPSENDHNQIYKTVFRIGRKAAPRFSGFRIPDGCNNCGRNIAVLSGTDGKEYLMIDGKPGTDSFDTIRAVSAVDTGVIHFIAEKNGQTALYDYQKKQNSPKAKSVKVPSSAVTSMPKQRDLTVRKVVSDRDGMYAATNRGVFFSFNNGESWKQYPGFGLDPEKNGSPKLKSMVSDGTHRYALTGKYVWYSEPGKLHWVPIAAVANNNAMESYNVDKFELNNGKLVLIDGIRRLRMFSGQNIIRDEQLSVKDMTAGGTCPANPAKPKDDPRMKDETVRASEGENLLIGTRSGLFLSANAGSSWKRISSADGLTGDNVTGAVISGNRIAVLTRETLVCYNSYGGISFCYGDLWGCYALYSAPWLGYCPSANNIRPNEVNPYIRINLAAEEKKHRKNWSERYFHEKDSHDGISFSEDGGQSWRAVRTEELPGYASNEHLHDIREAGGRLFLFRYDEQFFSDDWGKTWQPLPLPAGISRIDIASMQEFEGGLYLFTSAYNSVYRFTGKKWSSVHCTFAPLYQGRNCIRIRSDRKYVYTKAVDISGHATAMKFNKKTQTWSKVFFTLP
jgi:hypothetical protein